MRYPRELPSLPAGELTLVDAVAAAVTLGADLERFVPGLTLMEDPDRVWDSRLRVTVHGTAPYASFTATVALDCPDQAEREALHGWVVGHAGDLVTLLQLHVAGIGRQVLLVHQPTGRVLRTAGRDPDGVRIIR